MDGRDAETRTADLEKGWQDVEIASATRVGRYLVLSQVGAGGMGKVYAAYDPHLDRRVALKILHGAADSSQRNRLVREAKALARVSHPNVLTVHEVEEVDSQVVLASEYVAGGTLRDWLLAHPVPGAGRERLLTAFDLLIQAGEGLLAAHKQGLVHRDFKPSNVLLGTDGRVRVADFGLARRSRPVDGVRQEEEAATGLRGVATLDARVTRTGLVAGTPAYMAPEQWTNGVLDARTDQFSFCVVAWELIFGCRPFEYEDERGMSRAVGQGPIGYEAQAEVPERVVMVLRRGLAVRPRARFKGLEAIVGELEAGRARLGGSAVPKRIGLPWRVLSVVGLGFGLLAGGREFLEWRVERTCDKAARSSVRDAWGDEQRRTTRTGMIGTGLPDGEALADEVVSIIDGKAEGWADDFRSMCVARESGEWEETESLHAEYCLFRSLERFSWLSTYLAQPDPAGAAASTRIAMSMMEAGQCLVPEVRGAPGPVPPRSSWEELLLLENEVRDIAMMEPASEQQVRRLREIENRTKTLGGVPLIKIRATKLRDLGSEEQASELGREAFLGAITQASWMEAAELAVLNAYLAGISLDRPEEALLWIALGRAVAKKSPQVDQPFEYQLAQQEANTLFAAGMSAEAVQASLRLLALAGESADPSASGLAWLALGSALVTERQFESAGKALSNAVHSLDSVLGEGSEGAVKAMYMDAASHAGAGNVAASRSRLDEIVGHEPTPITAVVHVNSLLARAAWSLRDGEGGEAIADLRQAVEYCASWETCDKEEELEIKVYGLRASLLHATDGEVVPFLSDVLEIAEDDSLNDEVRFSALTALALASLSQDKPRRALDFAKKAALLGGRRPSLRGAALRLLGRCEWQAGNTAEGELFIREAIQYEVSPLQSDNVGAARSRFALAQLLWESEPRRIESVSLAREAERVLQPTSDSVLLLATDEVLFDFVEIRAWIVEHELVQVRDRDSVSRDYGSSKGWTEQLDLPRNRTRSH